MRYRVLQEAEQDLDEIFLYGANRASLEAADRIIDSITERFWLLGEHPNAGKPAGNIARGVKCFPAGKYLIYYRHTRGATDILHIFHGARDQRRALRAAKKRKRLLLPVVIFNPQPNPRLDFSTPWFATQ